MEWNRRLQWPDWRITETRKLIEAAVKDEDRQSQRNRLLVACKHLIKWLGETRACSDG